MADKTTNSTDINIDIDTVQPQADAYEEVGQKTSEETNSEMAEEEIDEDDIAISDKNSPIIMLFGPESTYKKCLREE